MNILDLTNIHRGQISTEAMKAFDGGLEIGTVIKFPARYQLTYNGQGRAIFYQQAATIQAWNATYL